VYGDLWIDTSNLEDFPKIYRYESVDSTDQWVQIDVTDQTSENGILFADARFMLDGDTDVVTGDIPLISAMLLDDYLDTDAPSYTLYPRGTLLWNTRRSFMNVKQFVVGAFASGGTPTYLNTWMSVSGNDENGTAFMGRKAQRNVVVQAMASAVSNSTELLEDQRSFNLAVAPGYPEMMQTLIELNNNRKNTAFIIGDSPMRLPATGNTLSRWANNLDLAVDNNEEGLVSNDGYLAVYYPSGYTRDLSGAGVVVPASHMVLRTYLRSDQQSYPWLAPAGLRRGVVDNALAIGYIDAQTGEFKSIGLTNNLRDVLYEARVNPITVFPGQAGVTVYGQKTRYNLTSALDRVNVARLIVYLRGQLNALARQYVFEPNDDITRKSIKANIEKELNDIKSKRALYDYVVQCDDSNNTPQRIDRNELWVDIAIEPVKAAEFIYIPIRVKNTGGIAAGL
jgi:Phage tail sheath C-terminal domain